MSEIRIWARCADESQRPQMNAIADRLRADGDPFGTIVTVAPVHPREVPDAALVLWVGGALHGPTLRALSASGTPVLMVTPDKATMASLPGRWRPSRKRTLIEPITHLYATTDAQIAGFVNAGLDPLKTTLSEPLEEVVTIPPFDVDEMRFLTSLTGTRPLWLAAAVDETDIAAVIDAQRHAARRSHRLMMIVCPAEDADEAAIARHCREAGLQTARRSEAQEPEDATQVYVTDGDSELGLWLRMAGITYLGGSFGPAARLDPFVAASLGSVLIHGPVGHPFAARMDRLTLANATHPVATPVEIGAAVETLLSVGDAAERAAAGWDVVSRGADLTNALVDRIIALTDGANR